MTLILCSRIYFECDDDDGSQFWSYESKRSNKTSELKCPYRMQKSTEYSIYSQVSLHSFNYIKIREDRILTQFRKTPDLMSVQLHLFTQSAVVQCRSQIHAFSFQLQMSERNIKGNACTLANLTRQIYSAKLMCLLTYNVSEM